MNMNNVIRNVRLFKERFILHYIKKNVNERSILAKIPPYELAFFTYDV